MVSLFLVPQYRLLGFMAFSPSYNFCGIEFQITKASPTIWADSPGYPSNISNRQSFPIILKPSMIKAGVIVWPSVSMTFQKLHSCQTSKYRKAPVFASHFMKQRLSFSNHCLYVCWLHPTGNWSIAFKGRQGMNPCNNTRGTLEVTRIMSSHNTIIPKGM